METRWFIAMAAAVLAATVSCGPRATPEECACACQTYSRLTQIAEQDRNNDVLEAIDREIRLLEDALERELEAFDQEVEWRLDRARDDDERTALIDEYEARVEARQDQFQPRFEALMERKSLGAGADGDEEALAGCIDRCLEERTGKHTADCQANSVNLVEFRRCK